MSTAELIEAIDALLPQTQCRRCGFAACRPYAEALVRGESDINRCPPGGAATIRALAALLGCEVQPLAPDCGEERPRMLARIDEDWCIGCKLCIDACPVDAIVGAPKRMHTVLTAECTGCELCIDPCPVDCIELISDTQGPATLAAWLRTRAPLARMRYRARQRRLAGTTARPARACAVAREVTGNDERAVRQREIAQAVVRARAKRARMRTRAGS